MQAGVQVLWGADLQQVIKVVAHGAELIADGLQALGGLDEGPILRHCGRLQRPLQILLLLLQQLWLPAQPVKGATQQLREICVILLLLLMRW